MVTEPIGGATPPRGRRRPRRLRALVSNVAALGVSVALVVDSQVDGRIVVFSIVLAVFLRLGLLRLVLRYGNGGNPAARRAMLGLVRLRGHREYPMIAPTDEQTGRQIGLRGYFGSLLACGAFLIPLFDDDLPGFAAPVVTSLPAALGWAAALAGVALVKDLTTRSLVVDFDSPKDTADLNFGGTWLAVVVSIILMLILVGVAKGRYGEPPLGRWVLGLPWLLVFQFGEYVRDASAGA